MALITSMPCLSPIKELVLLTIIAAEQVLDIQHASLTVYIMFFMLAIVMYIMFSRPSYFVKQII